MKKNWLARGVAAAAIGGLLIGCGSSPAASSSTTAATSSVTAATTTAASSSTAAASSSNAPASSGSSSSAASGTSAGSSTDSAGGGAEEQLHTATGALGTYLVDDEGRTLYMFTPDVEGKSTCYEQCATAWPPLTESYSAGTGLDASKLTTSERTDGSKQVVYGEYPLYYFAKDAKPGDTTGQGVGEKWYVVGVDGEPIKS